MGRSEERALDVHPPLVFLCEQGHTNIHGSQKIAESKQESEGVWGEEGRIGRKK